MLGERKECKMILNTVNDSEQHREQHIERVMLGERKDYRMILNIVSNSCRVGKQYESKNGRHSKMIPFILMQERMPIEWPKLEKWLERHRRRWMPRSEKR